MRFLILGQGPESAAWAETVRASEGHEVVAAWPPLADVEGAPADLDDALAWRDLDAVIVGGPISFRDEALRRVAAAGLHAVALHPPGLNADPYYQVSLSREESGSIVVPDLPLRHVPEIAALASIIRPPEGVEATLDLVVPPGDDDLATTVLPRWTDLVRLTIGEVVNVSAFGEPAGPAPTQRLTAQFRGPLAGRAEVRIKRGGPERAILEVTKGAESRRVDLAGALDDDAGRRAILETLVEARTRRPATPDLTDGTRAMELAEAAAKSLRKAKMVDLHYERVSEEGNFKSVMTSLGCMILLSILVALPLSLAGPLLGLPWLLYVAYAIPPLLVGFGLVQLLKFGIQAPGSGPTSKPGTGVDV